METGFELRIRSAIPGRIRLEPRGIDLRMDLASELERNLSNLAELTSARINPLTKRILVHHRPGLKTVEVVDRVHESLRRALEEAARRPVVRRTPGMAIEETIRLANAIFAGVGAALVAPLLLPMASPFLVGMGAFAVTLAAEEVQRIIQVQLRPSHAALRRLLEDVRPNQRTLVLIAVCGVATVILSLARFVLIGLAVDLLLRAGITGAWLLWLGVAAVVIHALQAATEYAGQILWRNLALSLQHQIRVRLYAHVQRLEVTFLQGRHPGALASVLTEDVGQLEAFAGLGWQLLKMLTNLIIVVVAFLVLAPEIAWLAILTLPVLLRISFVLQHRSLSVYRAAAERSADFTGLLTANLDGVVTIKGFAAEEAELARMRDESASFRRAQGDVVPTASSFIPIIEFLSGVAVSLVRGGLPHSIKHITPGTYTSLMMLTGQLFWPLTELGKVLDSLQRSLTSIERIHALLDEPLEQRSGTNRLPARSVRGEIAARSVCFGYPGGPQILKELSLHIPAGSTTAIVGPTGSGKSTLTKLLLRFYEPSSGQLMLDGVDLAELRVDDLRRAVGVVPQETFLFQGTVRDNIALGSPGASHQTVERAARLASAHPFIEALPRGYDTVLGPRGAQLSGGQRQRIALARALLKDPPILVLDEATSHVDNKTEADILAALRLISPGRTIIVIAHRLSAVRDAQYIYVLDDGRVREQGVHGELLREGGVYSALWRLQAGPGNHSGGQA